MHRSKRPQEILKKAPRPKFSRKLIPSKNLQKKIEKRKENFVDSADMDLTKKAYLQPSTFQNPLSIRACVSRMNKVVILSACVIVCGGAE